MLKVQAKQIKYSVANTLITRTFDLQQWPLQPEQIPLGSYRFLCESLETGISVILNEGALAAA